MLELKTKEVYFITAHTLEEVIKDHFGVEYEIVPEYELQNDVYLVVTVVVNDTPDEYADQEVEEWLSGEDMYGSRLIPSLMHDLACHYEIPVGTYVIDCSW
jgi:hypothetical protein